jgi:hypothetical protein
LAADDLDLLLEHLHPLAGGGEGKSVRLMLGLQPSGAHAELDAPAARDVVGGDDVLRQHRGMAERDR